MAFTPGLGDQRAVVADAGVATTLMVRNIPAECTQEFLLELWPNHGTYDFLYLPRNAGGKSNLGYCFVNFVSEAHAAAFKATPVHLSWGGVGAHVSVRAFGIGQSLAVWRRRLCRHVCPWLSAAQA